MAERDEVAGFLGGLDSGEDGGVEDGSLFALDVGAIEFGDDGGGEVDGGLGSGDAAGDVLPSDVDHLGLEAIIDVREVGHVGWLYYLLSRRGRGGLSRSGMGWIRFARGGIGTGFLAGTRIRYREVR